MNKIGNPEFSGWFTAILTLLIIFRGFGGSISAISTIIQDPMWGSIILVLAIIRLIAYIQVLNAKKIGVYLWAFVSVAISIIAYITRGQDWIYLLLAPVLLLAMFLFFQIRKDGISAWQVIFGKTNKEIDTTEIVGNGTGDDDSEAINQSSSPSSSEIDNGQVFNFEETLSTQILNKTEEIASAKNRHSSFNYWIILPPILLVLGGFWLVLSNKNASKGLGDYVYISYTPPNGLVHLDKDCNSNIVIKPANELYREKAYYRGYTPNYDFCAKCISDEQMKQIEDSIAKYKELQ